MYNPFKEINDSATGDVEYISRALNGDLTALERLVLRHQSWIFNIAVNMTSDVDSAQDITQEVLIKVITKLSTYDPGKASFRTWLYRIVANHFINTKMSEKEKAMSEIAKNKNFDDYCASIPDTRKSLRPGYALASNQTKTACLQCLVLCLPRKERLVFVLGAVFGANDIIGSEICGTSRVNYRKILSRSRNRVNTFFVRNCSLVNENNPCTCSDKTGPLEKLGMINEHNLHASRESESTIGDVVGKSIGKLEDSYYEFNTLFGSQPFYRGPDMTAWFRELLGKSEIKALLNIM